MCEIRSEKSMNNNNFCNESAWYSSHHWILLPWYCDQQHWMHLATTGQNRTTLKLPASTHEILCSRSVLRESVSAVADICETILHIHSTSGCNSDTSSPTEISLNVETIIQTVPWTTEVYTRRNSWLNFQVYWWDLWWSTQENTWKNQAQVRKLNGQHDHTWVGR